VTLVLNRKSQNNWLTASLCCFGQFLPKTPLRFQKPSQLAVGIIVKPKVGAKVRPMAVNRRGSGASSAE
jgi:hypothetical protein